MKNYVIDAAGRKLGRVASEASLLLRGKNLSSFSRAAVPETFVEIINAARLDISEKKASGTVFARYSGYPGGLKFVTQKQLVARGGYGELLRKTILGMLPRNRLRRKIIKHVAITE